MKHISSTSNPLIKQLNTLLEKSGERKKQGLFIVEGFREIHLAMQAGYKIHTLVYNIEKHTEREIQTILPLSNPTTYLSVTKTVFDKIAYRSTGASQVLAVGNTRSHDLETLPLSPCPLIVVVETVEKPGNLGAILRTADAAKVDAVILCDPTTDLYNPNVIRSSVGCFFTCPIGLSSSSEAIDYLQKNNIQILSAALSASEYYHLTDFTKPSAIVLGTEATGLTEIWLKNSHQNIKIPMLGKIDSMNVSNSAAILMYEAKRQRNFLY
jgi:TrmH family RNA methyltransferase